jgi:hypothetical protein
VLYVYVQARNVNGAKYSYAPQPWNRLGSCREADCVYVDCGRVAQG